MHGEMRCRTPLFVLTWVGDCKTNFWDLLHRSPYVFNPRVEMSTVARFVDLLTDGMVVFLSLNSGRTVQYCTNMMSSFLRLFGLHGDVNDAHLAGANRLQKKQNKSLCSSST